MGRKSSTVQQLDDAYRNESLAIANRCRKASHGRPNRWREVAQAHNRKVMRNPKSNAAKWRVRYMIEADFWAKVIRDNNRMVGA